MSGDGKRGAGHCPKLPRPSSTSTCVNSSHPQPSMALRTTSMRSSLHVRIFTPSPPRARMTLRRSNSAPFRMPCKRDAACKTSGLMTTPYRMRPRYSSSPPERSRNYRNSDIRNLDPRRLVSTNTSSAVTCLPALLPIVRGLCSMPSRHGTAPCGQCKATRRWSHRNRLRGCRCGRRRRTRHIPFRCHCLGRQPEILSVITGAADV